MATMPPKRSNCLVDCYHLLKGKWKDKAFAAGVNRGDIEQGAQELGVDLTDHITTVIESMRVIAPTLGLDGSLATH